MDLSFVVRLKSLDVGVDSRFVVHLKSLGIYVDLNSVVGLKFLDVDVDLGFVVYLKSLVSTWTSASSCESLGCRLRNRGKNRHGSRKRGV